MAYDLEEQESIDQMKAWWDRWGTPVTAAVCVVCLGFAGWNGWNWYQRNQAAKASGAYVQLQNAAMAKDMKNVASIATGLVSEYGSTIYAPLGALTSAGVEAETGNLSSAEARLMWVIEKSGHPEYDTLARVRLAGVLLSAKRPDEALRQLEAAKPVADQQALVDDRFGDVWLAKGDVVKARAAWVKALKSASSENAVRIVIERKLAALAPQE